jgi:two-component system, LytTR family, response regulator LytT
LATKTRILVVEDDRNIAENLMEILELSGEYVTDTAPSAAEAIKKIDSFKPNLVLLDINIQGDKDGIMVGEIIRDKYDLPFVYLTAFAEKAILERAKKTLPFGYLVKPFKVDGVLAAIEIALSNYSNLKSDQSDNRKQSAEKENEFVMGDGIFVRSEGILTKVKFDDIIMVSAEGKNIHIQTNQKTFFVKKPLKEIEPKLPEKDFLRIHKSHIVRLESISAIKPTYLYLGDMQVSIGRAYYKPLKDRMIALTKSGG